MSLIHNLTGGLILMALMGKIIFHIYLDCLDQKWDGLQVIFLYPKKYFLPYSQAVETRYQYLKFICNLLFYTTIVSFVLNVVCGVIIYFQTY